jgi:hypothetical protein
MKDETPRSGRSAKLVAAAVIVGLIGSGTLVWQASSAAFTASTDNPGNHWTSGSVAITDDDFQAANFNVTGVTPGDTDTKCILVTYNGDIASAVKLYGKNSAGTLGQYLTLDVSEGSGTSCASQGTLTRIFGDGNTTLDAGEDSLSEFAAKTTYGTGIGTWTPSVAGSKKPYVFTFSLADDNNAQAKSADIDFVWEAQSSS